MQDDTVEWCTFCRIVAKLEPAEILYEDDDVMVFRNRLRWVPVMLLVVPKVHRSQEELWRDLGPIARVAVEMGEQAEFHADPQTLVESRARQHGAGKIDHVHRKGVARAVPGRGDGEADGVYLMQFAGLGRIEFGFPLAEFHAQ